MFNIALLAKKRTSPSGWWGLLAFCGTSHPEVKREDATGLALVGAAGVRHGSRTGVAGILVSTLSRSLVKVPEKQENRITGVAGILVSTLSRSLVKVPEKQENRITGKRRCGDFHSRCCWDPGFNSLSLSRQSPGKTRKQDNR
ncbi:hypothetical protein NDU88_006141 [Pleurodeles waltl]|uniref:Uncharacterized protein n=1 Tax=Pleurodeles waltl TaxID=8319 RepID=A0AAV7ULA1_PLEWA|nr:hypothetical protein NDU88_006141 [Pleurodeles waltl]